jgi:hypothetical protein
VILRKPGRILFTAAAAAILGGLLPAGTGSASPSSGRPHMLSRPAVRGTAQVGNTLHGLAGRWAGARPVRFSFLWLRCDRAGRSCRPIPQQNTGSLLLTSTLAGATVRLQVGARNAAGAASAQSAPTASILAAASASSTGLSPGMYFSTLPAGSALPRSDALCASLVTPRPFEPRPQNATANHTVPTSPVAWPTVPDQTYWKRWITNRNKVTGNYTGTTDEILRWGACKWGLDEDTLRAVAVQESDWHESEVGDNNESFGIMQVKDHTSDGHPDLGGYPSTLRSTALNVDVYGAWIRSCLDGDFYDGGDWLYGGKKVVNDFWGCVGAWFSGDWHDQGADEYAAQVQAILARKGWLHLS